MASDLPLSSTTTSELPQPTEIPGGSSSPDDVRRQVEQEQALADAQRKVRQLEEEVEKVKREKKDLESDKDGAVSTTNQLRTQLSALQSSHHKSTSELSVLQTRIDAIEREKKELFEETERLQQRSNKNTQELYSLRTQKSESSQKIAHLDVEVSELRMTTETAKFNEKRSSQALDSARAEILNLSKAVADVEERFGRYRAEKQAEQSQSRSEHETLLTQLSTIENSYRSLQRTYNDQSQRLSEAHANIATLTSAAAAKKASVSMEFHQLMEENRILEKRGEEARSTVAEREAELERMAESYGEKEKNWEEKWKKEERTRRVAEKRAEDLKVVVERLALAGGEGTDISPAAALAGGMKASGKTYTQFYTDYTIQEGKLRAAENEVARLTGLLDEIGQDIAEKKPLLDEQAAEHGRAIERANALAAELASVITTRDAHDTQIKSLNASSIHHQEEVTSLQTTVDDLSRQVQGLLRQIALRDDPSLAGVSMDGNSTVEGDIITEHLLEFRSIRSLQEQNQKLLKLTRTLMSKLDQREINKASAAQDDLDTGATLDQATETINKLHTQLLDAQKKINEATRERDLFSKLLARGEGLKWSQQTSSGPFEDGEAPHQQTINTLQAELDVVKNRADVEIKEVKEDIRVKAEQVGVAEVERAKAEAKVGLLEEQSRMLNDANNLQKQEYSNLEIQYRQLQGAISQAHNEQRSALEQVATRQAEADRLRNETAMLRAEKEQWKSTEARLQSDFAQVQSERVKLQQLIDNLKNVAGEAEQSRVEERSQLEKRIEELQREATALRGQIEQARSATQAAEAKVADFDSRLEAATSAVRAEKQASDALADTRSEEIKTLQGEVEKLKSESDSRYRIGINWKRRADALTESQTNTTQSHTEAIAAKDKEIQDVNEKIEGLNKEIEGHKVKITDIEKKLVESERVNALKENTVQRLQSELNKAQSGAAVPAAGDKSAELATLQQKLEETQKELETAKTQAATTVPASAPPATTSTDGGALTEAERTELNAKVEQLQKEKDDGDQRYADNVTRVNRVNASLKSRVDQLTAERQTAQNNVDTLQAKVTELEKKISDLESAGATIATGGEGTTDQAKIDQAVKAAVTAREAELNAEHSKSMAAVSNGSPQPDASALQAKEAELNASFETKVSEAVKSQSTTLQAESSRLKGQVEELTTKVKALERQVKTAEISRKTLERQKAEVEKKLEAANGGPSKTPNTTTTTAVVSPIPGGALSATAGTFNPATATSVFPIPTPPTATPASTTAHGNAPVPITTGETGAAPVAGGPAVRGAPKGKAKGVVRGITRGGAATRGNSILSTVNATLNQASTATVPAATTASAGPASSANPTSPTSGTKRPLEEGEVTQEGDTATQGDIIARIQGGAAAGAGGERGRVLKRPRAAKGARAGRRSSAGGSAGGEGGSSQGGEGGAPTS
ncbi:uncharacterized protein IL334_003716 [Kwoniella shivajii]|uniref:NUA/TPR/MLP1-2-like domain-containing protein n=1 Tax=Kwoniella shivajii TaxID=564305 RepID=A0ABZ1CYC1_9TREE|nr:hypothetical protein IL334_003716 [Kwoniella shivajii]